MRGKKSPLPLPSMRGRKSPLPLLKTNALTMRGSPEYKAWVKGLSEATELPVSTMVREAMAQWAKRRGFKPPSPPI